MKIKDRTDNPEQGQLTVYDEASYKRALGELASHTLLEHEQRSILRGMGLTSGQVDTVLMPIVQRRAPLESEVKRYEAIQKLLTGISAEEFGATLVKLRHFKGLSAETVGYRAGFHWSTILRQEKADYETASLSMILKTLHGLGYTATITLTNGVTHP